MRKYIAAALIAVSLAASQALAEDNSALGDNDHKGQQQDEGWTRQQEWELALFLAIVGGLVAWSASGHHHMRPASP